MNSTLEITDSEFLIKLDRKKFNVNFIRTLLKIVEVASPSSYDEFTQSERFIATTSSYNHAEPDYFSSLDEK
ncbi:hypothetical protein HH214_17855 [Mucilaginibacter robiniae]|uniref:Uncharacterized protein n=1 Tax=Mucilaginibacter robiniae TaxID=2728022 RepID=A0A7L5EB39_9SPHI|nr:hypothetical protein [Mucilaginibacter robiniae]QJD97606.1 hypothetical protein HH214_17855 [Mucilaginibacter robiniae]